MNKNLIFFSHTSTLAGALQGTAMQLGNSMTAGTLFGLSTLAFRTVADPEISPYCQSMFDCEEMLQDASALLGLSFESLMIAGEQKNKSSIRELTDKIASHISRSYPVLFLDALAGDWLLIADYNRQSGELLLLGKDSEAEISSQDLSSNEDFPLLWCLFPEKCRKAPSPAAEFRALSLGINHYFHEKPNRHFMDAGYDCGRRAWTLMLESLEKGRADLYGLALNIRLLREARTGAWNFLAALTHSAGGFTGPELDKASAEWEQAILGLLRLEELFPLPPAQDGHLAQEDERIKPAIELFSRVSSHEQSAMDSLKQFVNRAEGNSAFLMT
ncbi:MAG: hypothetical protein PHQ23_14030 [Candidatus Wallbacteria bacterium]|nr:hypothetical protein [Candidatus Wallbacteria bacterium]